MKKYISSLILIFIFMLPINLQAKKLYLNLTLGLTSGGDIIGDVLLYPTDYECVSTGQGKRSNLGMDIYLELVYQLTPHFSLSLGNGYSSRMLQAKTQKFSPAEGSSYIYEYTFYPEINSQIVPFCFSAIYSLPVSSSFQINIKGGIGYYYGNFESVSKFLRSIPGQEPVDREFRPSNFDGKGHGVGFHWGTGFDVDLSEHLILIIEGLYTKVKFKNFESSVKLDEKQLLFSKFVINTETNTLEFFDYYSSEFDLTGFSLRAGLKLAF